MKNINKPMDNLIPMKRTVMDIYKELVLDKPQKISVLYDNGCDIDSNQLYHQSMANRIYGSSYLNGKLPASSMYGRVGTTAETPHLIRYIEYLYGNFDDIKINHIPCMFDCARKEWAESVILPRGILCSYDTWLALSLRSKTSLDDYHFKIITIIIGEKIKRSINYRNWSNGFTVPLLEIAGGHISNILSYPFRDVLL